MSKWVGAVDLGQMVNNLDEVTGNKKAKCPNV